MIEVLAPSNNKMHGGLNTVTQPAGKKAGKSWLNVILEWFSF